MHEFGRLENMFLYDSLAVTNRMKLFQPLLPRQFFIRDVLHRERQARKITWDELFFDLIFVAALARCCEFDMIYYLVFKIFSINLADILKESTEI
ncbi:hypothetical protein HK096_004703, partial [Nowakowskiella sp. JEL0078]